VAEHIWSVLCRQGILDTYTNGVTLVQTLEGFEFSPTTQIEEGEKWTYLPFQSTLVSLIWRSNPKEPERAKMRVWFVSPTGEQHPQSNEADIDLVEHSRSRALSQLEHLPFWCSGLHRIHIELSDGKSGWTLCARVPIEIIQKTAPSAP
jgi:hypothetical protein